MKITNISPGPRGIHTLAGSVILNPGQTIEADLSEVEHEGSKETGWFSFDGKADPLDHDGDGKKGGSLPNRTPQEVLAMAEDSSVQFMTFKAAAAKLLGDKTPAKKDEIVIALMELATNP